MFHYGRLNMRNKTYRKKVICPWDIDGYVELSYGCKRILIDDLLKNYKTVKNINKSLSLPEYWFDNFKRNSKIHTKVLRKIASVTDKGIIKEIMQFNDDKGSSSIPFRGRFPIKYDPLWHFLFCLSVGDGSIGKGIKKHFTWYQKAEGQKEVIALLNKLNFNYVTSLKTAKEGITIPQLVRKIGSFATGLDSSYQMKNTMIQASHELGKDFEVAFLAAFFMDEAGMSKSKYNSEVTLHQEGNLKFLEKVGTLLSKFNIKWSKNKKGEKWCIRIKSEGVIKLSKLFDTLKKYNISLLHREEIFNKKVEMSNRTLYRLPLREEAVSIRKYLLTTACNTIITLDDIRRYFKTNTNVSTRSRKLVDTMKKAEELQSVGFAKYVIKGE